MRHGLAGTILMGALAGCAKPTCGDSFCLNQAPASFSKQQHVDFDTYDVAYGGQRFAIYEGNHPATARMEDFGHISPNSVPEGFVEGKLYGDDLGYAIALRTMNRRSPIYVVVGTKSKNPNDLDKLLVNMRGKQSKEGF